jgi:hypothetical protein
LNLIVNRKCGFRFDRNCYPVSHWTVLAAGVFLAPYLQGQMAILDEWDGPLPVKVLMKNAAAFDGYVGRLTLQPFNAEYLKRRMQRRGLQADTPVTLMARLDRREPCQRDRK